VDHRAWLDGLVGEVDVVDADVYLVGWGHRAPNDLTLETLALLRRVTAVFALPPLEGVDLGVGVVDLRELATAGRARSDVWDAIAETVVTAATTRPPAAFATFGSAAVGTPVVSRVLEAAAAAGLQVHVSPAVSCLEAMWSAIRFDPFNGVLVCDAAAFLRGGWIPPTAVDMLLTQAPALDLTTVPASGEELAAIDLAPLRNHLLRFYPAGHEVVFVQVASHAVPARVNRLALGELGPSPGDLSTLLVPRLHGGRSSAFDPAAISVERPARFNVDLSRLRSRAASAPASER
jgi:hypothetical protein